MSDYVQIDLAGQVTTAKKFEEATHISMNLHMKLVERLAELEALNQRIYGKLMRELKAKKQYRDRAQKAALVGKKRTRSRPKREVVVRRDGYYAVHLVDLEGETDAEALAGALEYIREETIGGRLHRITDPGTGCWEAEIEIPLTPDSGADSRTAG